jgi:preprotein translocase subunit YajC
MIFFTIYFFTFVLNWYNPYNIYPNTFLDNISGIPKYLTLTTIIYITFILTSCLNLHFSIVLFFLIFILLNIYLYRDENKENKENNLEKIDVLTFFDFDSGFDISNLIQVLIIFVIIIGFVYNLIVSKKLAGNKFNLLKFLFSRGICS